MKKIPLFLIIITFALFTTPVFAQDTTTSLVADIFVGTESSFPQFLTVLNNELYFRANDGTNGTELWKTDGTTSVMVADIRSGSGSGSPQNLTVFNNELYFTANDGTTGFELWKLSIPLREIIVTETPRSSSRSGQRRISQSQVSNLFAQARGQEATPTNKTITSSLLRQGSRSTDVSLLQAHINRILADYYAEPAGPVDGIFGPLTKQGVQRLQATLEENQNADLGIAGQDGIVGPFTRAAVNMSC
jgi:ELWxxDGT repeat protein